MRILIVEDEARIAKRIERMTGDILGNSIQLLTHISTLPEAMEFTENNTLDLVLLDLNLNGEDGFNLLTTAVSQSFHTIVISAYKDQALAAFEHGVLDFVPKPFNQERLAQALKRAQAKEKLETPKVKFLAVKQRSRIQLIPIEEVIYIKGAGPYSELFLTDGSKALHDKSLEKLEQLLSPSFERIHKSYLVKMTEVKEILVASGSKYQMELKNGVTLPIGRTKYKEVKERWL